MSDKIVFGAAVTPEILTRFEDKIIPEPNSGCWLWLGSANEDGYGNFWHGGRARKAHRFSYALANGDPPAHLDVMHSCDVPCCVNPAHLSAGTTLDNMKDMWAKARGRRSHGTSNGNSRLTIDGLQRVREMIALEFEYAQIARHVGISPSMVGRIAKGTAWRVAQ